MAVEALQALLNVAQYTYRQRTPRSASTYERATNVFPGGDTRSASFVRPYPPVFHHGDGAYLYDIDSNRYLDCSNNWASLVLGHAHPVVVEAVSQQVRRGSAWSGASEQALGLAELLQHRVHSIDSIRFTNSGSEAVLLAARIARAYTGRNKTARAFGSYHGCHEAFEVLDEPTFIEDRQIRRARVVEFEFDNVESISRLFHEHHEDLAAVIVEPFLTHDRIVLPHADFLQQLRSLTNQYGVLFILDEVVTFRTSVGGAQQALGVRPDLTITGKIIGGGYPVGGVGGRREIMDLLSPSRTPHLHHSGTFNANPVTMTAGLATLELYNEDAIEKLNALGDRLRGGIRAVLNQLRSSVEVVGFGSLAYLRFNPAANLSNDDQRQVRSLTRRILLIELLSSAIVTCVPGAMFALSTAMTEQDIDFAIDRVRNILLKLDRVIEPA